MVNVMEQSRYNELEAKGVTVIDFFATWCGPCKMLAPVIDEVSEELADKATFFKADIDENPDLAEKFGIMSVPTVVVLKDGAKQKALVGFKPKDELKAELEKLM